MFLPEELMRVAPIGDGHTHEIGAAPISLLFASPLCFVFRKEGQTPAQEELQLIKPLFFPQERSMTVKIPLQRVFLTKSLERQ